MYCIVNISVRIQFFIMQSVLYCLKVYSIFCLVFVLAQAKSEVEIIRIGPDSTINTASSMAPKTWENLDVLDVHGMQGVQDSQTKKNPHIQESKSKQTAYEIDSSFRQLLIQCVSNDQIAW